LITSAGSVPRDSWLGHSGEVHPAPPALEVQLCQRPELHPLRPVRHLQLGAGRKNVRWNREACPRGGGLADQDGADFQAQRDRHRAPIERQQAGQAEQQADVIKIEPIVLHQRPFHACAGLQRKLAPVVANRGQQQRPGAHGQIPIVAAQLIRAPARRHGESAGRVPHVPLAHHAAAAALADTFFLVRSVDAYQLFLRKP
jgi:hypothetical protein